MNKKFWEVLLLVQTILAIVWSLYYGWFGDIYLDFLRWDLFKYLNWYDPCQLCWFARIFMYPILPIVVIWLYKKSSDYINYVIALAVPWFLLELYQYHFQMTNSKDAVKSFICGVKSWANCAATDVIYNGFITIPLLCLVAFIVILICAYFIKKTK